MSNCPCACHSGGMSHGSSQCPCQKSTEERKRDFEEAMKSIREYWNSPEGLAQKAAEAAEAEAAKQVGKTQGVSFKVTSNMVPHVLEGEVEVDDAAHAYYFRERHDLWSITTPDMQGVRVASGDSSEYSDLVDLVQLIGSRMRRHVRSQKCEHRGDGPYCPQCGSEQ